MPQMSAGVHKSELNWSTYQEKQLDVLTELRNSFQASLSLSKSSEQSLSRIHTSLSDVAKSLSIIASSLSGKFPQAINDTTKSLVLQSDTINRNTTLIGLHGESLMSNTKALEEVTEATRAREDALADEYAKRQEEEKRLLQERQATIKQIGREALAIMDKIGRVANKYSETSNNLVKFTGSALDVSEYRDSMIHGIVAQLNKETGYFYSGTEAYAQMASIANSAGIGNLEDLKEMTRPLLLAQEAIDVNISDMAKLLGRWSNRYTFNSSNMETMIDDIRGYTSNNNASAEAALQNITKLESWIAYTSRGDTDKMNSMSEAITKGTAWLESMNVDTARYTDYITKLLSGEALSDKQMNILLGENMNAAYGLAQSGNFDQLYKILFESEVSAWNRYMEGTNVKAQVSDALMYDFSGILDAKNAYESAGYTSLEDFVLTKSSETAVDAVEGKYVSLEDKLGNWLTTIIEHLAGLQETLGFGLTDVVAAIGYISGAISIAKGLGIGAKVAGSAAGAGGGGLSALFSGIGGGATGTGMLTGASTAEIGTIGGAGGFMHGGFSALSAALPSIGSVAAVAGPFALLGILAYQTYKGITTYGTANGIEESLKEARDSLNKQNVEKKIALSELKTNISNEKDLEKARADLINSGILNEKDVERARTLNKEGLEKLTQSYIDASDRINTKSNEMLTKYGADNVQSAKEVQGAFYRNIEQSAMSSSNPLKSLWKGLSNPLSAIGSTIDVLTHPESLSYGDNSEYTQAQLAYINTALSQKTNLTKDEEKFYNYLSKSYDVNSASYNIDKLSRKGFTGTKLQNLNIDPDILLGSVEYANNVVGTETNYTKSITESASKYRKNIDKIAPLLGEAAYIETVDDAIKVLDELKKYGATSKDYPEMKQLMTEFGITGYAKGANLIPRDQLAYLHAGEAVTPAKYNPANNMNELEYLRKESKESIKVSETKYTTYLIDMISAIKETKELLEKWKTENTNNSRRSSVNSKFSSVSAITNPLGTR